MNVKFYDKNKDGLVQFQEVPAYLRAEIFRRFDKNKDNVLDKEEQPAVQAYLDSLTGGIGRLRRR